MPKREHGTKLCAAGDTDDNGYRETPLKRKGATR